MPLDSLGDRRRGSGEVILAGVSVSKHELMTFLCYLGGLHLANLYFYKRENYFMQYLNECSMCDCCGNPTAQAICKNFQGLILLNLFDAHTFC